MKLLPTPDQETAIQAAAFQHGRTFKDAIRRAWCSGNYSRECLNEYSGTLQAMRNSEHGYAILESLRVKDYAATPEVAALMGKNAARGEGPRLNPFGVDTLAKAWRKAFTAERQVMPHTTENLLKSLGY